MPITDHDALDELCTACGIALRYQDIWGNYHQPSFETKQSVLGAIGLCLNDNADIHRQLEQLNLRGWDRIVAPVIVVPENESQIRLIITLESVQIGRSVSWVVTQETGDVRRGDWTLKDTDAVAERIVDGIAIKHFELKLPNLFATGYHQLTITTADGDKVRTSLIVTPQGCYQPPQLNRGDKLWGIAIQLYALRSNRNWGIGDFTDLHLVIDMLAPLGVNIIGLNPLHALSPQLPEQASPYSPTSRDFLNPLYLDIEKIGEFETCEKVRQLAASREFQTRLNALREANLVDYTGVWSIKLEAMNILYRNFRHRHIRTNSARAKTFREFQADGGADLQNFAIFEAMQSQFQRQDASIDSWLLWPQQYQDPDSDAIADWVASNDEEIEFHQYLQWNSELQLAEVQRHSAGCGMTIGIYRDLAVGVAKAGAQTWSAQSLYALDSSTGAPPDDFNLHGQDWNLPPPKPQMLVNEAYEPFIKTLRANMRHAGALRIDHVMGLKHLFWIPANFPAEAGSYVTYPFSDLLAILALESQRNQCMVIGEDLGTVPAEVRAALESKNILSYRILYFEKNWQQGSFKSPSDYPYQAVATIGSHDLPTFSGFWQESDLDLSEEFDLFPSPRHQQQQRSKRARDRAEIVAALQRENLVSSEDLNDQQSTVDFCSQLILPVHRYLARSNAALMLLQLEDIFGQMQQINLPGTVNQHPNWRRKLPVFIEHWLDRGNLAAIARAITSEREIPNQH